MVVRLLMLTPHICLCSSEPSSASAPFLEALYVHLLLDISLSCQLRFCSHLTILLLRLETSGSAFTAQCSSHPNI